MAITTQAFDREISALHDEVHQVLTGVVKVKGGDVAAKIEDMKALTTQEWQSAARALLLARKTSVLEGVASENGK